MRDSIDNDYDGHMDGQPGHPYNTNPDYPDRESYMPLPTYYWRRRRSWLTDSMVEAAGPCAGNPAPLGDFPA